MGVDSVSGSSRMFRMQISGEVTDDCVKRYNRDRDEMYGMRVNEQRQNAKREQQKQTKTLRMMEQDTMPMLREIRGRARGWMADVGPRAALTSCQAQLGYRRPAVEYSRTDSLYFGI